MGPTLKAAVVAGACALTLAGCGSSTTSGAPDSGETSSVSGSCAADSAVFEQAEPVGSVDIDGDGRADPVKLTTGSQECPARLIARDTGGYLGGELPGDDPGSPKVFGVKLSGHQGDLLVTRQDHPRGGYQLHIYALGGTELVELQDAGKPLVPFVATDTRPISATVDCQGSDIVVQEAVAGSGGQWDIRRTTYEVSEGAATKAGTKTTSKLTPKRVDQLMPAGRAVFPSCRA
jgi:hypothetical protein